MWTKHYKVDGQVTQHLSPFEQRIVTPMFKDMGSKIFNKVFTFALEAGPGLFVGIVTFKWANDKFDELSFHHRA